MKEIPRNTFGRNEEFPLPLLGLLLRLLRFSLEKEKVKEAFHSVPSLGGRLLRSYSCCFRPRPMQHIIQAFMFA